MSRKFNLATKNYNQHRTIQKRKYVRAAYGSTVYVPTKRKEEN